MPRPCRCPRWYGPSSSWRSRCSRSSAHERRRGRFRKGNPDVVNLIAEQNGHTLGWACHGPYRDGEVPAGGVELYAIYVDAERYGGGVGQALIAESIRRCTDAGHTRMYLWVLEGNARARRFYERSGFRPDGAVEPFEVDGVLVPEVRYVMDLTV
ncbi:N-acetyltransferase family protein [Streptomyces sp. CA-249302]|uniref:GNAT family N-acetyltransferase n=1 Tax=Streptomyces sp. CA-249302 TaxID=3240058 RepID=UPI003D8D85D0